MTPAEDELSRAVALIRQRLRQRLPHAAGDLSVPEGLALRTDGLPDWWSAAGNRLFAPPGIEIVLRSHPGEEPPRGAVVLVGAGGTPPAEIMLAGEAPAVLVGSGCSLLNGYLYSGDRSTIVLAGDLASINGSHLNARNGGLIAIGRDNLWASHITVQTDDMHAIFDRATKERINRYGSVVEIGEHVWLGLDALISPGARIGPGCVIGARSVVTRAIPPNCVAVGAPARVVRRNIAWSYHDVAPENHAAGRERAGPVRSLLRRVARHSRVRAVLAALRRN